MIRVTSLLLIGRSLSALRRVAPTIHAVAASSDAPDIQSDEGGSQPTPPLHLSVDCGSIRELQTTLFHPGRVIGAYHGDLSVQEIPRRLANRIVRDHHYSGTVHDASYIHLGVFWRAVLVGVIQYGKAMNPTSQESIVRDTQVDEYLELNRMWVSDEMPRNTESAALSQSFHYLRHAWPKVSWIQSFADERCRRLGVVYQASNFLFCGSHVSRFYELDGRMYHRYFASTGARSRSKTGRPPVIQKKAVHLQANLHRAFEHRYRQFRYVKFLKRGWRHRLLLPVLPYPKPETRDKEPAA